MKVASFCRRMVSIFVRRPRLLRSLCIYTFVCVVVQSLILLTRTDQTVQTRQQQQPQPQPDTGIIITEARLAITTVTTANTTAVSMTTTMMTTQVMETTTMMRNQTKMKTVNPHPFKYVINNPDICTGHDVYIIAYVHTAPSNYGRRRIIRQTWANASNYDRLDFLRVVFVLGRPNGTDVQSALELEASTYGDIVQEDFVDSYHNLTYKAIAALKWISERCSHARYVLKIDDDIFVNPFGLIPFLKDFERTSTGANNSTVDTIMCAVWFRMPVMRSGLWKVEKDVWPDDFYPEYCSGSAFMMTIDVARTLYLTSFDVPFFWIDDLYITGLVTRKAKESGSVVRFVNLDKGQYAIFDDKLEARFVGPNWKECIFGFVYRRRNEVENIFPSLFKKVQQLHRDDMLSASTSNRTQSHVSTKLTIISKVS